MASVHRKVRLATRGSELAVRQTRIVANALSAATGVTCEFVTIESRGDRLLDTPIREVEGIGFFTREIEAAVLDGRADAAVHSYKDLPVAMTDDLVVAAVPARGSPHDLLLVRGDRCNAGAGALGLQPGARVGTSSPRRAAQLRQIQPDVTAVDIRGNVPTRLSRLQDGTYDALVLAQAGLDRLEADLSGLAVVELRRHGFLPAPGQGALAVQCRGADTELVRLLSSIGDASAAACIQTERLLLEMLGGGCYTAVGCLADSTDDGLELSAVWFVDDQPRRSRVRGASPQVTARRAFEALTSPSRSGPGRSAS